MNMHVLAPGDTAPVETPNALIPRATIEDLCARRDRALALYAEAHAAIGVASSAVEAARKVARVHLKNSYNCEIDAEKAQHHYAIRTDPLADYMTTARRIVDTDFWAYVIELTDLQQLMDKKAKDDFRQSLLKDPPELTVENVYATLQQCALDASTIFKRGIAECFSKLDRRFRSHDGWKIGSRIILTYMFSEDGYYNYRQNHEDTMIDIERVFRVLDNAPANYTEIVSALRDVRTKDSFRGARRSECETEYFLVRAFKNGNAHLWFKRDDLLEKVNQLLGEYYGAPIPEDREPTDDGGLFDAKRLPAKNLGWFPTPDEAAERLIEKASLYRRDHEPKLEILEPSAGTGHLARRCVSKDAIVDCVELDPARAHTLKISGRYRRVLTGDFLSLQPTILYDRVVMNPPFDRERDIDHVMHALKFLKPDGRLVAIMSAGTEFRETRKSTAFRELMESMGAEWDDLPHGSFASVGTCCNTAILSVWKNGSRDRWRSRQTFQTP